MEDIEKRILRSRWYGIRNRFNCAIQRYKFAKIYIGFNLIWREGVEPNGIIKIPIPFLNRDIGLLRYKKIILNTSNIQIYRIDQKIDNLNQEIKKGGDKYGMLTMIIQLLEEIKYGCILTKQRSPKEVRTQ